MAISVKQQRMIKDQVMNINNSMMGATFSGLKPAEIGSLVQKGMGAIIKSQAVDEEKSDDKRDNQIEGLLTSVSKLTGGDSAVGTKKIAASPEFKNMGIGSQN